MKIVCGLLMSLATLAADIRVVPVPATSEPDAVKLSLVFPKRGRTENSTPIQVQLRLNGYAVGTRTDVPRAKEIYNDSEGQAVHVIIDNNTYFEINESLIDALDDNADYYVQVLEKNIPFKLKEGFHLLRAFPVRSFNESLKGDNCFVASFFYFKSTKGPQPFDLTTPFLTYNEPMGEYPFLAGEPILLDFYISNCQLSQDGYKVRLTIDGNERMLTEWTPYYVYGLSKGKHTFRLELLDQRNMPVAGQLSDHTEVIVLK